MRMKRRLTAILLGLCMMLTLMPVTVFAADGDNIYVGGVGLTGSAGTPAYALTDTSGAVITNGATAESYNIKWDGSTLTLSDAKITQGSHEFFNGEAAAISCETDLMIELAGENTVKGPDDDYEIGSDYSYGIYADGDLAISGSGALNATGGTVMSDRYYVYSCGIEAEGSINISGGEVTATGGAATSDDSNAWSKGISSSDGNVTITGGTVTAKGGEVTALWADSYGIDAYGNVSVNAGKVEATGGTAMGDSACSSGIYSYDGNITISGGEVNATGDTATGGYGVESYGIYSYDGNVTIESGKVTAAGGEAASAGDGGYAYSIGIYSDSVIITGGEVTAAGKLAVDEGKDNDAYSYGIEAYSEVVIENATVYARGDQANYSAGIYMDGDITIESGSVQASGGRAVNQEASDAAASVGIHAGDVTINGGEVIAAVGLTEHGIADGIYVYGDITINGGEVKATGASYSIDGVAPQYSGGIFSETGDITITGKDTVVNANGGCADDGITAIAAKAGDIVIKGGNVRADGAYGAYTSYEGLGNGLSALKDGDGTGGNIIISGGTLAATGYTDSIYYEGELIARPESAEITMDVLNDWIVNEETWEMDWDKMDADASELAGSPFTEETVIARAFTEGKLYFGAAGAATDPAAPTDPTDPVEPTDPTDPTSPTNTVESTDKDNPETGDNNNITLWILILVISGCAAMGIPVYNKRKKC